MTPPSLPAAVTGDRLETTGRSGRLSYYVAGQGAPMLLIHSINAAASVREVPGVYPTLTFPLWRTVYERLTLPVWLAHGTRGDLADFSEAGWVRTRKNWQSQAFDTGALVYFQQPELFFQRWSAFLAQ